MQYIVSLLLFFNPFYNFQFIHRVVQHFLRPFVGTPDGFDQDYVRWIDERSQRLFVDNINSSEVYDNFFLNIFITDPCLSSSFTKS